LNLYFTDILQTNACNIFVVMRNNNKKVLCI